MRSLSKKARGAQLGMQANLPDAAWERRLLVRRAHLQQHPGLRFYHLTGELHVLGFTAPREEIFHQQQIQRLLQGFQ
jgi:hypothetical protein